jgi:hypothetical protein
LVADGKLTPEEALAVASIIDLRRKTLEVVELDRRVAALEQSDAEDWSALLDPKDERS